MLIKLVLPAMLLFSLNGFAREKRTLNGELTKMMNLDTHFFENLEDNGQVFTLQKIRFRTRLYAGVDIPFIAKAEIRPEIELIWVKK